MKKDGIVVRLFWSYFSSYESSGHAPRDPKVERMLETAREHLQAPEALQEQAFAFLSQRLHGEREQSVSEALEIARSQLEAPEDLQEEAFQELCAARTARAVKQAQALAPVVETHRGITEEHWFFGPSCRIFVSGSWHGPPLTPRNTMVEIGTLYGTGLASTYADTRLGPRPITDPVEEYLAKRREEAVQVVRELLMVPDATAEPSGATAEPSGFGCRDADRGPLLLGYSFHELLMQEHAGRQNGDWARKALPRTATETPTPLPPAPHSVEN